MKKHYYLGWRISIDEEGNEFTMPITMGREQGFKRKYSNLEDLRRDIGNDRLQGEKKNMTRTYEDGTQVKLCFNDKYESKWIIEEHFDEYEEIETYIQKRKYNEKERKFEEEIDVWI